MNSHETFYHTLYVNLGLKHSVYIPMNISNTSIKDDTIPG